ncbi:MAG: Gmad2 immunoglobulin-like domain-containing protein [Patescibacteria group bacterium]
MKYSLLLVLAFFVFFGAGCLNPVRDPGNNNKTPIEIIEEQPVSGLFGVISAFDLENNSVELLFPDGGQDTVFLPKETVLTEDKIGSLARVSGMRDLATRSVSATEIETIKTPDVHITSPEPSSTVTSPLLVFGFAKISDHKLQWVLKDGAEQEVARGFAYIMETQKNAFVPFRFEIFLPILAEQNFILVVSDQDDSDSKITLPLTLLSTEVTNLDVFFAKKSDKETECSNVYPLNRSVAQTAAKTKAAISELIIGPTQQEIEEGYISLIPDDASIFSVSLKDGDAHVIFEIPKAASLSSCARQGIIEMVRKTLMQLPLVDDVVIEGLE